MNKFVKKIKDYYRTFFVGRNYIEFWLFTSIIVLLILFDVFTKIGVFNYFKNIYDARGIEFIPGGHYIKDSYPALFGLINIQLSFNLGAAFSSFGGSPEFAKVFLSLLSLVAFLVLSYVYVVYYNKFPKFIILALILLISGCFGNMVDRFGRLANNYYYKYGVIDFLDMSPILPFFRAIFNVADVCVVASIVTLLLGGINTGIIYILERKRINLETNNETDNNS